MDWIQHVRKVWNQKPECAVEAAIPRGWGVLHRDFAKATMKQCTLLQCSNLVGSWEEKSWDWMALGVHRLPGGRALAMAKGLSTVI